MSGLPSTLAATRQAVPGSNLSFGLNPEYAAVKRGRVFRDVRYEQRRVGCLIAPTASWSPPAEPDSTPSIPPEFTPPSEPAQPYRPPPEFAPPDRPPGEEPQRGDPPLRPIRPDREPEIPDPESPNADPVRTPERRKEITEPPQREAPDSQPERE